MKIKYIINKKSSSILFAVFSISVLNAASISTVDIDIDLTSQNIVTADQRPTSGAFIINAGDTLVIDGLLGVNIDMPDAKSGDSFTFYLLQSIDPVYPVEYMNALTHGAYYSIFDKNKSSNMNWFFNSASIENSQNIFLTVTARQTDSIPEPSTTMLSIFGLGTILLRRNRHKDSITPLT